MNYARLYLTHLTESYLLWKVENKYPCLSKNIDINVQIYSSSDKQFIYIDINIY